MTASAPSAKQMIDASWYSERLIILLWALKLAEMPEPHGQCDTSLSLKLLPPYAEVDPPLFISGALLRPKAELVEAAEAILDLH